MPDLGIFNTGALLHNPCYDQLSIEETDPGLSGFEKGHLAEPGAISVDTGIFTGRSPKDKNMVKEDTTGHTNWWSVQGKNDNKAMSVETWSHLKG